MLGTIPQRQQCEILDEYIESVTHLPPAPKLIVELLPLFNQPDRDVDRIVELICHDPALTAETLKVCNNALFGVANPSADIFDAIEGVRP